MLLESKANPNTLNAQGVVPLVICAAFGTDQVLDLLVKDERTELDQQVRSTAFNVQSLTKGTSVGVSNFQNQPWKQT